jgi:hypothetical protein
MNILVNGVRTYEAFKATWSSATRKLSQIIRNCILSDRLTCYCAYQCFTIAHARTVCTFIPPLSPNPENKFEPSVEDPWCHEKGLRRYELVITWPKVRLFVTSSASVSWYSDYVPQSSLCFVLLVTLVMLKGRLSQAWRMNGLHYYYYYYYYYY